MSRASICFAGMAAVVAAVGVTCASPAPPPAPTLKPLPPPPPAPAVRFCVDEGASHNCLLASEEVSAHAVASSGQRGRIVVAFPAANCGGALWLGAVDGKEVSLRIARPPRAVVDGPARGVRLVVESQNTDLSLEQVVVGSVRTIREFQQTGSVEPFRNVVERGAQALARLPEALRREAARLRHTPERLRRRALANLRIGRLRPLHLWTDVGAMDGRHWSRLEIRAERARWDESRRLLSAPVAPLQLELTLLVNYAPLKPLAPDRILRPDALAHVKMLERRTGAAERRALRVAVHGLSFLATEHKYLAGSWRFLTYFGRDTLMTLWLMQPALQPEAIDVGIRSVLERLAPDGRVAHEESLGDQAARERLEAFARLVDEGRHEEALGELQRLGKPVFDYKMVDDDLMLAPLVAAHLLDAKKTSGRLFAPGTPAGQRNLEALARNLDYVIGRASALANGGKRLEQLIALREGQVVGDWRDSEEGLGGGRFPASVNLYLMPAALDAVLRLLASPDFDRKGLLAAAGRLKLRHLGAAGLEERLRALQRGWDGAASRFRVRLSPADLRARLRAFLRKAPLGAAERRLLREQEIAEGIRLADLVDRGKLPPTVAENGYSFDALALDATGRPIEVMHTDDGFLLLAMDLAPARLVQLLPKYELAYPLGLIDRFGVYVANPALSSRPADHRTFDRGHYHGTVVWSWQQSMLQRGLMRQLRHLRRLKGEEAGALAARVEAVLRRIAAAEERVGPLVNSELWTVAATDQGFQPAAYGHAAGHATESNAIQLWSSVHLAVSQERAALGLYGE